MSAESVFTCITRPQGGVRPSAVLAVAMQIPPQVLQESPEQLRFQAQELVDWFFGGRDPEWLPEHLLYEEVEELVEEYYEVKVEEEYEHVEPEETYYEE